MSAFLHVLHITNFEPMVANALGPHVKVIKPIEYLLTCPVMMLVITVLGGEAVPYQRQMEVMVLTGLTLIFGFFASMSLGLALKMMFFAFGCIWFALLLKRLAMTVREHSGGKESLCGTLHGSVYQHLCLKIVSTWILFPIWWILSADGLSIVSNTDVNIIVTAALNIFAKGLYVVFVQSMHDKYIGETTLMEHPTPKSLEHRDAHFAAARLGPERAIAAIEKSIEQELKSMELIKQIMLEEGTSRNGSKDSSAAVTPRTSEASPRTTNGSTDAPAVRTISRQASPRTTHASADALAVPARSSQASPRTLGHSAQQVVNQPYELSRDGTWTPDYKGTVEADVVLDFEVFDVDGERLDTQVGI
jgi:hypothetical protein